MRKNILRYIGMWLVVTLICFAVEYDGAAGFEIKKLATSAVISAVFVACWALIVERSRRKNDDENNEKGESSERPETPTVQDMVERYGEPDATIVTDGTRGMAPDSTVLIYDHSGTDGKGFLVYNGLTIDKTSITDMTFHRDERPLYRVQAFTFPERFEIIVNTTDEEHPKVFINAGHDLELAKETLVELRRRLG